LALNRCLFQGKVTVFKHMSCSILLAQLQVKQVFRMAKISFDISARTARLIGQENFTNAEGAVIELVKNSYDADANNVVYPKF
ncbi:MAG: hypothetical protein AAFQ01_03435, partial [Bacteroidota bacterium]